MFKVPGTDWGNKDADGIGWWLNNAQYTKTDKSGNKGDFKHIYRRVFSCDVFHNGVFIFVGYVNDYRVVFKGAVVVICAYAFGIIEVGVARKEVKAYNESLAIEWTEANPASATVQYKPASGGNYITVDKELIRARIPYCRSLRFAHRKFAACW